MQQILQKIDSLGYTSLDEAGGSIAAGSAQKLYAVNPSSLTLSVGAGAAVDIVMLHGDSSDNLISISLGEGATLNLTQLYVGMASHVAIDVNHKEGASSKIVAASISHTAVAYNIQLCGLNTHSELSTLQLGSEMDNNSMHINMRHMSPDSSSYSLSKCVASGESNISFEGLVYVAHDAQRTVAEQNCRSIELSDTAHIVAQPQLEIYADDVKCSHGATVGQVNSDAIYYMRQRGLSEAQARRVQIEGFIIDIVDKCDDEELRAALSEIVTEKLQQM